MALLCKHLGHTLLLPGDSFYQSSHPFQLNYKSPFPPPSKLYSPHLEKYVKTFEVEELLKNPPDVIFINFDGTDMSLIRIFNYLIRKKVDVKLVHYSGNDLTSFEESFVRNLITMDASTASQYDLFKIHHAFWIPWIDWEEHPFLIPPKDAPLHSYLGWHYSWPNLKPAKECFDHYIKKYHCYKENIVRLFDWIPREQMFKMMEESSGTLHIKNEEGTGFTILQSLAKGRPVFLKRSFSLGKKLMNWCIEDQTAIFFDNEKEFKDKLDRFLFDEEYRCFLQENTAKQIRRLVNNERQALIFEHFLQNLK